MGVCSSFHPKNITGKSFPAKSKADHPFTLNINFSVLLEKDEDLIQFQNQKTFLMVTALNQKFTEKHTSQKISDFYKNYTLNQYYMDFLLTENQFNELLGKEIDLHLFFYNDNYYFEKKTKLFIRPEAKDGFISDDELINLDLIRGHYLFKNNQKKVQIGVKYRIYGDFIYSYILEQQKKFLSFFKFFEFLNYSEHYLLEEFYDKNITMLNQILNKFRSQRNANQAENDYFNTEFNLALDSLFTFYYKKNLRLKLTEENRDDSYLKLFTYNRHGEDLITDGFMFTEGRRLIDKHEKEGNFINNNIEFNEINLKMGFGKTPDKTHINNNQININFIDDKNIEKDYELNPEKQKVAFLDYETLLTMAFYTHDPIKQQNNRNIQYNLILFAKNNLFYLFKIIWRDLNCNALKKGFLHENFFNILYAASAENPKMLNIFDMIFKNESLYQIYEENMNFANILSLIENSELQNEVSKSDIFPCLLLSPKSRDIVINPDNYDAIKSLFVHHKNGQAKLDLIEILSTKPNLISELLNCTNNFQYCHLRLYNLFAYILTMREIVELLCFNKNIGEINDKANENIYAILNSIESNHKKITLREISDEDILSRSINNPKINFNFILRFCDNNFFANINDQIFSIFNRFRNNLYVNHDDESLNFINKNLLKFMKLVFKFTKIPIANLEKLLDRSLISTFSELIYSQIDLFDYEEINYFLGKKFEFIIEELFKAKLREPTIRKIVIVIMNDENIFAPKANKKPLRLGFEGNAAYDTNNYDQEAHLMNFKQLVNKEYLEKFFKIHLFAEEKQLIPFYVLSSLSKIEGVMDIVTKKMDKLEELYYRNVSFEKFYEINFLEEYTKIAYVDLQTYAIFAEEFQSNSIYKNISSTEYPSENENDIELSDVKVISKESFSFNYSSEIPILLKDKNNLPFYPCYFYLQQPKEEADTNVKSALFLSGKGASVPLDDVRRLLKTIENVKDYSKVDYGYLKFMGYLEFDKIKKGMYKELRSVSNDLADFVLVILISNFENEIILTTGPFGCYGAYNADGKDYIARNDYKYLKEKFLHDEL